MKQMAREGKWTSCWATEVEEDEAVDRIEGRQGGRETAKGERQREERSEAEEDEGFKI